jgi:hypothetical protein
MSIWTVRKVNRDRGAWANLCMRDGFYHEPVKRRTIVSSLHRQTKCDTYCFSICSTGGRAAREEGFIIVLAGGER